MGLLDFPNGVLARFETSIANAERHRVEIAGTRARLVIDDPWVPGTDDTTLRTCMHGESDRMVAVPGADSYALQAEHFADVVTGRAAPLWPLEDSLANMAVLDALRRSAREGRVVPVGNPDNSDQPY
ncbi:MAG: hypothetical protein GXP54_01485 [Deltaproteobacteria bacterium]|nr:hypothetical protein [Deltaproteobacteria bacterium]